MVKTIEVEFRGQLSKKKYAELDIFFNKYGKFKTFKERVLIDYSCFIPGEELTSRTKDIRLRVTNKVPEIIVKVGKFGGSEMRKELSVLTNIGEFDKLVEIFGLLGLKKGVLCFRKSKVYDYKGIEFALVEVPGHSYYFEAEMMVHTRSDKSKAQKHILDVCKDLGLKTFDDDGFYAYIERLNKESNEVFEFKNHKKDYFKKRFKL
ncbi:MAG TPA: CYTH domain-containing protein [Candidatus Nanoarchaeia archaeon]|nr:CYTH domain-containing protein [Candidatus Nanoarchaeia archaeon]